MKKELDQKSSEKTAKHVFTIDKLIGATPEILEEFLETGFTEIEQNIIQTLGTFREPISVRRIRSIIIQKTIGDIFKMIISDPKVKPIDREKIKVLLSLLNGFYIQGDFPSLIISKDISLGAPLDLADIFIKLTLAEASLEIHNKKYVKSEFLLSEKLAKYLSKANIPVYGMKRIKDTLENLERSGFVMERKQSPNNKTRLFFLNPKMIIFLRKVHGKKKKR